MKTTKKKDKKYEIGLSSSVMVDVLFILLIFFILASTLKKQEFMDIDATKVDPQKKAESEKKTQKYTVEIDKNNKIYLEGKEIDLKDLKEALENLKKQTPADLEPAITLRPDSSSQSSKLILIIDSLNKAGLGKNVQCEVEGK